MPQVASISQQIWDMKYRLKGPDGQAIDKTIEDSWRRVASALAAPEARPSAANGPSASTRLSKDSASCPPAGSLPAPARNAA